MSLCKTIKKWKADRQHASKLFENIEKLNEHYGGDWYLNEDKTMYCDSLTDRTVSSADVIIT